MASFAPAYQHENNTAWLNQLVGDIVDPHYRGSCRTYGQDYDDDLVDDPDYHHSGREDDSGPSGIPEEQEDEVTSPVHSPPAQSGGEAQQRIATPGPPPRVPGRFSSSRSRKHTSASAPRTSVRSYRHTSGQAANEGESRPSNRSPLADRSSQVLATPNSAFLTRATRSPMPESTGRILEDGTLAPLASPVSALSGQTVFYTDPYDRYHSSASLTLSTRSPAPPYDEVVKKPPRTHHRSLSSQCWENPKAEQGLTRQPSSASVASHFSGFAPHPAVRPLNQRAGLGEAAGRDSDDNAEYPAPLALTMIIIGICLSVFIISLDRNIITTAIPEITARFHSYDDIGWYGSAYLLTASAFQPLYGRIYMSFETKTTFLAAIAIFEIGSLIGALAPSSPVLVFGRAIQGFGSAGILTGSFVVGTHSVRLEKRPVLFAAVGILYGVGALCGPLIGGAFTDTIGWRWCFYINLPVGAVTFLAVFLCFKRRPKSLAVSQPSWLERILALDLIGNVILLCAATMLFVALQLSEAQYTWESAPVIGLLVGFGVTTLIFVGWMVYKGDAALIPPRIVRQRTVAASCGAAFFIYGALLIHAYYLPIWFQAIQGVSAIHSGVNMIPYMLANATFSLMAGIFVSKNGLFAPPAILGCAIGTIGAGLLATFKPSTSTGMWIGYEILVSAGLGMAVQQGFSAVQTALPLEEVPIGTAAVVASQSCGGAIFVSVGNTLLQNHLLNANNAHVIPGVNIRAVIEQGTTMFRHSVPPEALPALIKLYNESLQAVFIAAVPLCGCAFLCSLCMEWRSVKGRQDQTGEKNFKGRIGDKEGGKYKEMVED